jgi:hypothetical protein
MIEVSELELKCARFWSDFETEASQYDESLRNVILESMSREYAAELDVPFEILGMFVLKAVH